VGNKGREFKPTLITSEKGTRPQEGKGGHSKRAFLKLTGRSKHNQYSTETIEGHGRKGTRGCRRRGGENTEKVKQQR